ncbi:piggyBac transposable element-derived protein 4-like [Bacillus rossius redtenbacheri]|uniref:piggyBac transposable element-derived protein 4-like n=1 Tax=Bacillus rossius redtenbacheri TaxID=93214 RepID=UPI002FDD4106
MCSKRKRIFDDSNAVDERDSDVVEMSDNSDSDSGSSYSSSVNISELEECGQGDNLSKSDTSAPIGSREWSNEKGNKIITKIPFHSNVGVNPVALLTHNFPPNPTKLDCFRLVFDHDLWQSICTETNDYATQCIAVKPNSNWFPTTCDEIQAYFTLCVMMAQAKKHSIRSYWSGKGMTRTPGIREVMSLKRFLDISRYLHFQNNNALNKHDRLCKIAPVLDYFRKKFPELNCPGENLSLDESLMKFRGRLCFVQYNPSKRARFGIKIYKLCDSKTGYCFSFSIYTGKTEGKQATLASEAIVMKLMEPYQGVGHTLFVDNWYSSPKLFEELHNHGTNAVGTVRHNRNNMPKDTEFKQKLHRGESMIRYSESMSVVKWMDKKPVLVLSTCNSEIDYAMTKKVDRKTKMAVMKPRVVINYNTWMGGVDKQDQQLASFPNMRRYVKGYKKVFFYVMDMALYNTYLLWMSVTGKKAKYSAFRIDVMEELMASLTLPHYQRRGRRSAGDTPMRLQAAHWAHFPRFIPPNPGKQNPSRRCVVCSAHNKRSETRWECKRCVVALHVPEYFEIYHTKTNY